MLVSKRRSPPQRSSEREPERLKRGRNADRSQDWDQDWDDAIDTRDPRDVYATNPVPNPTAEPIFPPPVSTSLYEQPLDISQFPTFVPPPRTTPALAPTPLEAAPRFSSAFSSTGRVTDYPDRVGQIRPSMPPDLAMASQAPTARELFLDDHQWPQGWPSPDVGARVAQAAERLVGPIRRSSTPPATPPADPPTVREYAELDDLDERTVQTDPRLRALVNIAPPCPQGANLLNHLRWWLESVRHRFWAMSHWRSDVRQDLCARCGWRTGYKCSITRGLPHESFVWMCANCQRSIYQIASERCTLKNEVDVRPFIESQLIIEKNSKTYHPPARLTLPLPPSNDGNGSDW